MNITKLIASILLISILIISCGKEDEVENKTCLDELEVENFEACDSQEVENCDLLYVGQKFLSESSKKQFSDFCLQVNEAMIFENSNGDVINFLIDYKGIARHNVTSSTHDTIVNCKTYCMDVEFASLQFKRDSTLLWIQLTTDFIEDPLASENIEDAFQTSLRIYQTKPTSSGSLHTLIQDIPYQNHLGEEIPADILKNKYHSNIELNGSMYSNIITPLNQLDTYILPYFSIEEGFIGFEDSSGTTWTRQ